MTRRIWRIVLAAAVPLTAATLRHEGTATAFPSDCAGLQAALNAAQGGDIIELTAGTKPGPGEPYYGCGTTKVRIPNHPGAGFVTVRSAGFRNLPDGGTRLCPAGSLPERLGLCSVNVEAGALAIVQFEPNFATGLQAELGAHHWRFIGLEIRGESNLPWSTLFSLDMYGATGGAVGGLSRSTLSDRARAVEIDRCWIHGYYDRQGPQKAVMADGSGIVIRNSVIEEFKADGQDGQGIFTRSGPGPLAAVNNFLAGGAENFFAGGARSNWPGTVPALIAFTGNYSTRDPRWWRVPWSSGGTNTTDPAGACTPGRWVLNTETSTWWQCVGGQWEVSACGTPGQEACPKRNVYTQLKNLFELKAGKKVQIEGNVFVGAWTCCSQGAAVLIPNTSVAGNGYTFVLEDVSFRYNVVGHSFTGIAIGAASAGYMPPGGLRIEHNLFDSIGMPERSSVMPGSYAGSSKIILGSPVMQPYGIAIRHNTAINSAQPTSYLGGGFNSFGYYSGGPASTFCPYCQFLDNVLPWNNAPITGDSGPTVNAFFGAKDLHYWDHGRAAGNTFAWEGRTPPASHWNDYKDPCCSGNRVAALMADVLDSRNHVREPYRGTATDGSDPGADIDTVSAMTAGSGSGLANPYLRFRLGSWVAGTTTAALYFQAPAAPGTPEGACTVRVSPSETLSPEAGYTNVSGSGVARTVAAGGLDPGTLYHVAIACGGATRRGTFRTRAR